MANWNRQFEDREHRKRRVKLIRENPNLTHNDIDKLFAEEKQLAIAETLRLTEVEKLTVEKEELESQISELEEQLTVLSNREKYEELKKLNDMREAELYEEFQKRYDNYTAFIRKLLRECEDYQHLVGDFENALSCAKLRQSNLEYATKKSIKEIRLSFWKAPHLLHAEITPKEMKAYVKSLKKLDKMSDKEVRSLYLLSYVDAFRKALEDVKARAISVKSFEIYIENAVEQVLEARDKAEELAPKVMKLAKLRVTEL